MAMKWEEIEKWLRDQSNQMNWDALKESKWIDDLLSSFIPNQEATRATKMGQTSNIQIKEGKEVLEITYKLPDQYDVEELMLFVREDCVRIEGLPQEKIEVIKLPKLVKARMCKAKVEEDFLIIRLMKRAKPIKFHSHPISF